jgi:hypothetical protein
MMGRRQAVRHRILIPTFPGSIPGAPATKISAGYGIFRGLFYFHPLPCR